MFWKLLLTGTDAGKELCTQLPRLRLLGTRQWQKPLQLKNVFCILEQEWAALEHGIKFLMLFLCATPSSKDYPLILRKASPYLLYSYKVFPCVFLRTRIHSRLRNSFTLSLWLYLRLLFPVNSNELNGHFHTGVT